MLKNLKEALKFIIFGLWIFSILAMGHCYLMENHNAFIMAFLCCMYCHITTIGFAVDDIQEKIKETNKDNE